MTCRVVNPLFFSGCFCRYKRIGYLCNILCKCACGNCRNRLGISRLGIAVRHFCFNYIVIVFSAVRGINRKIFYFVCRPFRTLDFSDKFKYLAVARQNALLCQPFIIKTHCQINIFIISVFAVIVHRHINIGIIFMRGVVLQCRIGIGTVLRSFHDRDINVTYINFRLAATCICIVSITVNIDICSVFPVFLYGIIDTAIFKIKIGTAALLYKLSTCYQILLAAYFDILNRLYRTICTVDFYDRAFRLGSVLFALDNNRELF